MQKTITYNGADFNNNKAYVDLARGFSIANRKHYDQVNGTGVAQCYVVEVELIGSTTQAQAISIFTAPESWTVKNAVKRVHIARKGSMEKAGVSLRSLPAYSRNLKMYLDRGHRASGTLRPAGYSETENTSDTPSIQTFTDSSWLYTRVAHASGIEGDILAGVGGDGYELTLMGGHDFQASTGNYQTYDSVAVVEAYLEHRRNKTVNLSISTGDTVQEEPNPLALLMNDSLSGQEKMDIAKVAQAIDPPYQTASGSWAGTDALDLHLSSFIQTSQEYIRDRDVIRIPAGLACLVSAQTNPGIVRFHLHGIEDMQG